MASSYETTRLIEGGLHVDDRGEVSFVNGFIFQGVKRFYIVQNHEPGFVRAWHAHKKEAKHVLVITGAALIGAVKINDFDHPDKQARVERAVLSEKKPSVFYIPAGYANGAMSLTRGTKIMYFSSSSLEETQGDNYRFDPRYWDIWKREER